MRGLWRVVSGGVVLAVFLLSGCAARDFGLTAGDGQNGAGAAQVDEQWGYTIASAIEVCMPPGERQYLANLRCADGLRPTFYRVGNFGERTPLVVDKGLSVQEQAKLVDRLMDPYVVLAPGEGDHHIVDGYAVDCRGEEVMLYLDMYHCSQPAPTVAPRGFMFDDGGAGGVN